jgi:hypothetical protein
VRAQFLATEHWSLLATRSMMWSEAFSRASMFLTVLSAAVVALAFVAQATGFGEGFRLFALVVLPVVLLLGLATYSRLAAINEYDFWLVAGMNRLRHAYLEMAPELEPYFVTGHHDDIAGVRQSYRPGWVEESYSGGFAPVSFGLLLTSTPNVIGVINSLLAGVLAALVADALGAPVAAITAIGVIAGVIFLVVLFRTPMRGLARMRNVYHPHFPAEEQTGV